MGTDLNYFFDFISEGFDKIFSSLQEVSDLIGYLFGFFPPEIMVFIILIAVIYLVGRFFESIISGG